MKIEFGTIKGVAVMKVWDASGNVCRFDGDELEWLKKSLASGDDATYERPAVVSEPKPKPKPKPKTAPRKRGLLG